MEHKDKIRAALSCLLLACGYMADATSAHAAVASTIVGEGASAERGGTAIGKIAKAGEDGTAVGSAATAEQGAVAIGDASKATRHGTAVGADTNASAGSVAAGSRAKASGAGAVAVGPSSRAYRNASIAIGKETTTANESSVAIGDHAETDRDWQVSFGAKKTDAGTGIITYTTRTVSNVSDGTEDFDAVNKRQLNEATIKTTKALREDTKAAAESVLKSAKAYSEKQAIGAEGNAVARSTEYTDNSSSLTLERSNTYTNHRAAQAENNAVERSNAYTDNRFGELKHQVDRNEKRANGGIAGAMAMTAIPSVPGHDFSFGMATSGYRGQGAIAAGVKANITQNTTVSLNTAWDSGNGVGVAAGFSVGW